MLPNHRRFYFYSCLAGVVYLVPFAIYIACNHEEYFKSNVLSVGLLVYVAGAFGVINLLRLMKNSNYSNKLLFFSVIVFIVAIVFKWIGDFLFEFSLLSIIGCVASYLIERVANEYRFVGWHDGRKIKSKTLKHRKAWSACLGFSLTELDN